MATFGDSQLCRKCLYNGVAKWVSRVGSSAARAPSPEFPTNNQAQISGLFYILTIIGIAALISTCLCAVLLRRNRLDGQRLGSNAGRAADVDQLKWGGQGDEAYSAGGRLDTDSVELVVMAGEEVPTFLAHPVPAASHAIIQCPPLHLSKPQ